MRYSCGALRRLGLRHTRVHRTEARPGARTRFRHRPPARQRLRMDDAPAGDSVGLARPLQLLEELHTIIRHQADAQQAAEAEQARLRRVIEDAAMGREGMLDGQRASRAVLQSLIDALRAAVSTPGSGDEDVG